MADNDDTTAGHGIPVLEQYERDRDADRERIAQLEDELAQARQSSPADVPAPVRDFAAQLQRARDLGDEGELARLWRERDEAEEAAQLQREQAEQAEADAAVAERFGWANYQAETARLANSDDQGERDAAAQRLPYGAFVQQARAKGIRTQVDAEVHAIMDAEAAQHGWVGPGQHLDHDSWVQAYRRELDHLARRPDDLDATQRAREVQAALDARVAELLDDPRRASLAPGSQEVPPGDNPQTIEGRLAGAEARARATGDWSEWDKLQVQATTQ